MRRKLDELAIWLTELVIWLYARNRPVLLLTAAVTLAALALGDAYSRIQLLARGERVPGKVVEIKYKPGQDVAKPDLDGGKANQASCGPMAVPVVEYHDSKGVRRMLEGDTASCPPAYKLDQPVVVLIDPQAPDRPKFMSEGMSGWLDFFLATIVMVPFAGALGFFAWLVRPSREAIREAMEKALIDPAWALIDAPETPMDAALDDAKIVSLLPVSVQPQDAHRTGGMRLRGVVATAEEIKKGNYPLELCELTAYMAALAYHEPIEKPAVSKSIGLEEYFEQNCPHFENLKTFNNSDTEGLGFVFDGAAFVILRGTAGLRDWRRNLKIGDTRPDEFVPQDSDWQGRQAPRRHRGFAEGWNVIREDVERWIKETPYGKDPDFPFIFAGHSLGGALSFLGAWEFAKRGRKVAAVITFGAARPGGVDFCKEYKDLGLDERTLRLEFTKDIVPMAQALLGHETVGREWRPRTIPLSSQTLAVAAIPVNWIVGSLQESLFGRPKDEAAANPKGAGSKAVDRSAAKSGEPAQSLKQQISRWLLQLVIFLAFSSVLALAAHKMQKRYALALSVMSYRRIRARRIKAGGGTALDKTHFDACYEELCQHLKVIRGSTPQDERNKMAMFDAIPNLPRKVSGSLDLRWLNTFHSARSW